MKFDQTLRYCIKKTSDESTNVTYYINIQQNQTPLNSLGVYITSNNKYNYNSNTITSNGYQYLPPSQLIKTLSMIQTSKITCMDTRIRTIRSIVDQNNDKLQIIVGCNNGLISIFEENITELILSSLSNNSNNIKSSKSHVVNHLKGEVTLIKYFDRYIFASCTTSNESILLIETTTTTMTDSRSSSSTNNETVADDESHDCHSFMRLMIDYECSSVVPLLYEEGNYSEDAPVLHVVPTTISVLNLKAIAQATSEDAFFQASQAIQLLKLYFPSIVFDAIQYISNDDNDDDDGNDVIATTARYLVLVGDRIGNVWWFLTPLVTAALAVVEVNSEDTSLVSSSSTMEDGDDVISKETHRATMGTTTTTTTNIAAVPPVEYMTWPARRIIDHLDSVCAVTEISSIIFVTKPYSNYYHEVETFHQHVCGVDSSMLSVHNREFSILNDLYGIAIFEIDGYCTFLGCCHTSDNCDSSAIHYNTCINNKQKLRFPDNFIMHNIVQCIEVLIYQDNQGTLYANTIFELFGGLDSLLIQANMNKEETRREVLNDNVCNYIIRLDEKMTEVAVQTKQLTNSTCGGGNARWFIDFKLFLNLNNYGHTASSRSIANTKRTLNIEFVCQDSTLLQQHNNVSNPPQLLLCSIIVLQQHQQSCATTNTTRTHTLPPPSDHIISCLQNHLNNRFRRHPHNILQLISCYYDYTKHKTNHLENNHLKVQSQDHNAQLVNEIRICQQNKVDDLIKLNELDEELLQISSTLTEYEHLSPPPFPSYQQQDTKASENNRNIKLVYKFRKEVSNTGNNAASVYLDIHIASLSTVTMRALFRKHLIVSFSAISLLLSPSLSSSSSGSSYAVSIPIHWKKLQQPFEIMQEMTSLGLPILQQTTNKSGDYKKTPSHPPPLVLMGNAVEFIHTFDCSIPIKIEKIDFHLLSISLINENSNVKIEQEINSSTGSVMFLLNKILSVEELIPSYPPSTIDSSKMLFTQSIAGSNDSSFETMQYNHTLSLNIPKIVTLNSPPDSNVVKSDPISQNMTNILQQSCMKSIFTMNRMDMMQSYFSSEHCNNNNHNNDHMQTKFGDKQLTSFNIGSNAKNSNITLHEKQSKIVKKKSLNLNINTIVNNNLKANKENPSNNEMRQILDLNNNNITRYILSSDSPELLAHISAVTKLKMLHAMQSNDEICNFFNQQYSLTSDRADEFGFDSADKPPLIRTINYDFQQAMAQCAHIIRKYVKNTCSPCKLDSANIIAMKDAYSLPETPISSNNTNKYSYCTCPGSSGCSLNERELQMISEELWHTYCRIREGYESYS